MWSVENGVESGALKEHLMEELDYSLVPESAWNKLLSWYGISNTSRPIARYCNTIICIILYNNGVYYPYRTVVEYGLYMKHCKVEVYLLNFKLSLHPKLNDTIVKSFSRADTVGQ